MGKKIHIHFFLKIWSKIETFTKKFLGKPFFFNFFLRFWFKNVLVKMFYEKKIHIPVHKFVLSQKLVQNLTFFS
jgi:hypothetical protein